MNHTSTITPFRETAWTENQFEPIQAYKRTAYRLHQVREDGATCTTTYLDKIQSEIASRKFQRVASYQ